MHATDSPTDATPMRLNVEVFDLECARRGAVDDAARGQLVDTDRTTVWRWRHHKRSPSVAALVRIAERLEIPVDRLIVRGDA